MYGYPRYFDYFKKEEQKVRNENDESLVEVNIIENNAEKDYYPQNGWGDQTGLSQDAAIRESAPVNRETASEMPSAFANFISTPSSAYASPPASALTSTPLSETVSAPVSAPAVVPSAPIDAASNASNSAPISTAASTPDSTIAISQASVSTKANADTPASVYESTPANFSADTKAGALSVPATRSLYDAPGGYGVPDWLRDLYPERKERSYVVINIICSDYKIDRE